MTKDLINTIARTAGALYLIVVVTGIFSLLYVPSQLTVQGDALATASNIVASEPLFRLGIASLMINQIAFLLLPFVLYQLLQQVNKNIAVLMVALAVVSGGGGGIPFLAMLGERFPAAQFVVKGVLGPQSNAHGPNEFLHIPTAKRITAVVAQVLRDACSSSVTTMVDKARRTAVA